MRRSYTSLNHQWEPNEIHWTITLVLRYRQSTRSIRLPEMVQLAPERDFVLLERFHLGPESAVFNSGPRSLCRWKLRLVCSPAAAALARARAISTSAWEVGAPALSATGSSF